MAKPRAQIDAAYFQRHGAAAQRARRDAQAAPQLRLFVLQNRARLGPWARSLVEHAERALGARRTLWLLRLRRPSGHRLDELARPLVGALGGPPERPWAWLREQLMAHGLTAGDYLHLPNC